MLEEHLFTLLINLCLLQEQAKQAARTAVRVTGKALPALRTPGLAKVQEQLCQL
jgi:hypothetical protein